MAYAKLNSIFTGINGRVGNVVFYKRMGRQCLRKYVIPRNPDTESQRLNRHTFRDAVLSWKELPLGEKEYYNRRVLREKKVMSGYNLYISEFMKRNTVYDMTTDTVLVQDRSGQDTVPLRSSSVISPYMIKDRAYTAFTGPGYSPG